MSSETKNHYFSAPFKVPCYAVLKASGPNQPFSIERRAVQADDVAIEITYTGICHSDIHLVREEWGPAIFPMVPGHEIVGRVVSVGENVTKFKMGDTVGVGCMVDSCRSCSACRMGDEQYCKTGCVYTYNSRYSYPHCAEYNAKGGAVTYGGYSKAIVVSEQFVLSIPSNLDQAAAAPLLCAGTTTYSPLIHFGLKPCHKLAVVGLGGLGHMAVKFGLAFGAHVTVISRGHAKKIDALHGLKAHAYLDSSDKDALSAAAGTFDIILSTVSAPYDPTTYLNLLALDGKMIIVGAPPIPLAVGAANLIFGRKSMAGSSIGGIKETQDMLDFCGRNNITCDIELINADRIDEAYERILRSDVKYRFVIDIASI